MNRYKPSEIEKKWQSELKESQIYKDEDFLKKE